MFDRLLNVIACGPFIDLRAQELSRDEIAQIAASWGNRGRASRIVERDCGLAEFDDRTPILLDANGDIDRCAAALIKGLAA